MNSIDLARDPDLAGEFTRRLNEDNPPWELLENGRYMPRRIRGSFRGRELG